jgi:hypothetical protein
MIDERDLVERAIGALVKDQPSFEGLLRRRERKQRHQRLAAGVVAVVVVTAVAGASVLGYLRSSRPVDQPPVHPSITPSEIGTVTITNAGCTLDGLMDPGAGSYTLEVINETDDTQTVVVFKIASDARFARMLAFVERVRPRFGTPDHGPGHAPEDERLVQSRFFGYASSSATDIDAHGSLVVSGAFDPGTYGIQCRGWSAERDRPSNFIGPIDVSQG